MYCFVIISVGCSCVIALQHDGNVSIHTAKEKKFKTNACSVYKTNGEASINVYGRNSLLQQL